MGALRRSVRLADCGRHLGRSAVLYARLRPRHVPIALECVSTTRVSACLAGRVVGDGSRRRSSCSGVAVHRTYGVLLRLGHSFRPHGVGVRDRRPPSTDSESGLAVGRALGVAALPSTGGPVVREVARRHRMEPGHSRRTRIQRHARGVARARSAHAALRGRPQPLHSRHCGYGPRRAIDRGMARRCLAGCTRTALAPVPGAASATLARPHSIRSGQAFKEELADRRCGAGSSSAGDDCESEPPRSTVRTPPLIFAIHTPR